MINHENHENPCSIINDCALTANKYLFNRLILNDLIRKPLFIPVKADSL